MTGIAVTAVLALLGWLAATAIVDIATRPPRSVRRPPTAGRHRTGAHR